MFEAWGNHVVYQIVERVRDQISPMSVDLFIRIPPKPRLKEDFSLLEKAFYRKEYDDPYARITDKVGVRFVVLLTSDLKTIESAIASSPAWTASKDRDFEQEQLENPVQFDYAAIHYVVRCKDELPIGETMVQIGTPCEVQVKTILQHAYSELTHDTIYKPRIDATAAMRRSAAKSMALIEATNDYFEDVTRRVEEVTAPERALTEALASVYRERVGANSQASRLEGLLLDALESPDVESIRTEVESMLDNNSYLASQIGRRARSKLLFRQPSILLVYGLANKHGTELKQRWPLTEDELRPVFTDLGLSFENF